MRLLTRRGYDWSDRYPLIIEAALRLRKQSFVIDGEAVVLGPDGISDFDGLHSGRCNDDVRLYAFDLLSDEGVDMRDETLHNPTNADQQTSCGEEISGCVRPATGFTSNQLYREWYRREGGKRDTRAWLLPPRTN